MLKTGAVSGGAAAVTDEARRETASGWKAVEFLELGERDLFGLYASGVAGASSKGDQDEEAPAGAEDDAVPMEVDGEQEQDSNTDALAARVRRLFYNEAKRQIDTVIQLERQNQLAVSHGLEELEAALSAQAKGTATVAIKGAGTGIWKSVCVALGRVVEGMISSGDVGGLSEGDEDVGKAAKALRKRVAKFQKRFLPAKERA